MSLGKVQAFSEKVAASYPHIDLFVGNAGFMAVGNDKTDIGWEVRTIIFRMHCTYFSSQQGLGGMHLGHFAAVKWLVDQGSIDSSSRVVMVSADPLRSSGFHESLFEGCHISLLVTCLLVMYLGDGEGDLRGEHTVMCPFPSPIVSANPYHATLRVTFLLL